MSNFLTTLRSVVIRACTMCSGSADRLGESTAEHRQGTLSAKTLPKSQSDVSSLHIAVLFCCCCFFTLSCVIVIYMAYTLLFKHSSLGKGFNKKQGCAPVMTYRAMCIISTISVSCQQFNGYS